jgi:hypothetical protein
MNNVPSFNFSLFNIQGEQVAEFEGLILSVNTEGLILSVNTEGPHLYRAENLKLFPNFTLLNTSEDFYSIKFKPQETSELNYYYELTSCIINNRPSVNEYWNHLDFIEGTFDKILYNTL